MSEQQSNTPSERRYEVQRSDLPLSMNKDLLKAQQRVGLLVGYILSCSQVQIFTSTTIG